MSRPYIYASAILFLSLFAVISLGISMDIFSRFDLTTMNEIQHVVPMSLDAPFSALSLIGSFEVISAVLVLALLAQKTLNRFFTVGLYLFGLGVEILGKTFIHHPGPPIGFYRYNLGLLFPTSLYKTAFSYPSGHAMRISFVVIVIVFILWHAKKISIPVKYLSALGLILFFFCMLISRVSLGEHWSSDVISGALLGLGLGLFTIQSRA